MATYRRSIKITKNIRLNIGKRTISISFIRKGKTITLNSKGRISTSYSIPDIVKDSIRKFQDEKELALDKNEEREMRVEGK